MVGGELDGAHGAFSVEQGGALRPPCTAGARTRAVDEDGIGVGGGDLLPDLDGAVEGSGGEDRAEFGVGPAHFRDCSIVGLRRVCCGERETGRERGHGVVSEREVAAE